jgi:hypothetical protein
MKYYSHVLHFPNAKPFDNSEFRWPSFLGEFVKPFVDANPDVLYWFTFYTTCARFRILTDRYDALRDGIESRKSNLGLLDKGEEKDATLVGDLGNDRFIGPDSRSTREQRAELILKSLCATANLIIDGLRKRPDGYWEFERNENVNQNPDHSHLFSVVHLFHNMCASDAIAYHFLHCGTPNVMSYYYFHNALHQKRIAPTQTQQFKFKM